MDIRIDESGSFVAQGPRAHKISAVGALVLPSLRLAQLYGDYESLRAGFPKKDGEVKGSSLSEAQVDAVVALLRSYDAIFDAVVCDVASHRRRDIVGFRSQQVAIIKASVGEEHHPEMVAEAMELAEGLSTLSPQLFVQHQMILELVDRVLRHAPLYLVQRSPEELGSFRWIVDAKDHQLTKYEELWSNLIFPVQQHRTAKDPQIFIEGGDYSHFEPFLIADPDLPGPPYSPEDEQDLRVIDLKKVLMDGLSFEDSKSELGLEMVDIVTNALARAMNGHLQRSGWDNLGRLMIHVPRATLRMVSFRAQKATRDRFVRLKDHFNGVVHHVAATARGMLADEMPAEAEHRSAKTK